ncbi:aldehyde dehydrogenase family protein [Planomonospora sp. ID91781]|uniref:Aldehyde dehydrogenase n=2 Tax=Planomonospora parontospora TaxID=58119 RepID=A0AA37BI08_9ACTN|nr:MULTISPECIES: aldehyde dehydrogenase family protein [Planomonospora]MBG0821435.1 aldehyde dehydrogenase family protein [Planomonospora sp. ID91781]GGK73521.1 aldehyde dehydrogenase [Planomonospora parontospora]GII09406.1 aldehyde dehydrogenase [Planomonospora parontospora subsp. parontospora]
MDVRPFWLAGRPATGDAELTVTNSHDGRVVGVCSVPTPDQVEEAVAAAEAVRKEAAALPVHVRAEALAHVSRRLAERADEIARLITEENGKPVFWARGEVGRAVSTFRFAAEETRRSGGEAMRLDTEPAAAGRLAYVSRVPRGPILAITPFNFPLNLVAHKVAPAIAVGAPVVVKPAPATPLSALLLGEILAETDLPAGMFSVLPVPNERAAALVEDPRLPVVSFTGSGPVGYAIMESVPRKHVTLELGGNAAAVVLADADLDWAASRVALFSNYQAGQSCIAVQRVIVEESVRDDFLARLVPAVEALVTGDPADEKTQVGPLVSVEAAERVEQWVAEAVAGGARVLTGGTRDGATVAPTVLADAPAGARVSCEEVFGPVMVVQGVSGPDEAFAAVNDSKYGLQAGVFTRSLDLAFRANRELEVGGVVIGDVPSYRADQMPYGGVKESGVGREGVRSAMADYTYEKVMVLTGLSL